MNKEEFEEGNFKQVRRNNIKGSLVRNVRGINYLEGLVLLDEPKFYGGECWVRYENVSIIAIKK